jgi:hypothetical protein
MKSRPTGRLGMLWERDSWSRKFAGIRDQSIGDVTNFYCRSHRNVQLGGLPRLSLGEL